MAEPLLAIDRVDVAYGDFRALSGVSLHVDAGEIVAVLGTNGSGKSTILKAAMRLLPLTRGTIRFDGKDLARVAPHELVGRGVGFVLERRRLFNQMTVHENLLMGAFGVGNKAEVRRRLGEVKALLPTLGDLLGATAGRLSGGEQQTVAIGRALMAKPRLLLMDEPFLGLSPTAVQSVATIMRKLREGGMAILFNEQNLQLSFSMSERGYVLESGRMVTHGPGTALLQSELVRQVFLGSP